jgi:asparagine synthase (glutamine-hydrolysing)
MRCFVLLMDRVGAGLRHEVRSMYETKLRRQGLTFAWHDIPQAAVLIGSDGTDGPALMAQSAEWVAVGMARLDNRPDLERWTGVDSHECRALTDLQLILHVVIHHGCRYIPQILGDFAFVVLNGVTRTVVAACDAFAVRKLYYAEHGGLIAFSSRAELLSLQDRYEVEYLTRLVALYGPPRDLSVYTGVRPIPPASMAALEHGKLRLHQYWEPSDFEVEYSWSESSGKAIDMCRHLLADSVRLRLDDSGRTWSQLSGGLDSSSIVSMAQWLAERGEVPCGLAGTVTHVDRQSTGADERCYSEAVVRRWRVRNELILDAPTWHDGEHLPPLSDQPTLDLNVFPRELRTAAIVRNAGGRILLTGWGGDELFMGSMLFFADLIAAGHFLSATQELIRRAAIGRVSYWELAYKNALVPLLPRWLQQHLVNDGHPAQPWIRRSALRRYGLALSTPVAAESAGPFGKKYRHAVLSRIAGTANLMSGGFLADYLELRHPMLYRPLVEFALQLPPDLRARPHAHRWVLRAAMRGILPDEVRTRVGKQTTGAALAFSLSMARHHLAPLLEGSELAALGVVDAGKLKDAFTATAYQTGRDDCAHAPVLSTLAVEAWLQMRSGRWPREGHLSGSSAVQ